MHRTQCPIHFDGFHVEIEPGHGRLRDERWPQKQARPRSESWAAPQLRPGTKAGRGANRASRAAGGGPLSPALLSSTC